MNTCEALERLAPPASRLENLLGATECSRLERLEQKLRTVSGPGPVEAICGDLFRAGGKRLRALAALVVARSLDLPIDQALGIAEVVELTHGASLLHDDVIDEADTRRGQIAARRRWSNTLSVLGGNHLLLRSFDAARSLESELVLEAHLRVLDELLAAEVGQHLSKREASADIETYLSIARGKTGALFAFACEAPALCAGQELTASRLREFGLSYGVAFQVADDLRDLLLLDPSKPALLDLADGVMSLPLRLAAQEDPDLGAQLFAAVDHRPDSGLIERLGAQARQTSATRRSIEIARTHLGRAQAALTATALDLSPLIGIVSWLEYQLTDLERSP